jgi:protein subunit release factor B
LLCSLCIKVSSACRLTFSPLSSFLLLAQVSAARRQAIEEREQERQELQSRVVALTQELEEAQQLSAAAAKSLLEAQKERGLLLEQAEQVGCWLAGVSEQLLPVCLTLAGWHA